MKLFLILTSILVVLWLATVSVFIYSLNEGKWQPVVSHLTITDVKVATERRGGSIVSGEFAKLRACNLDGVRWYFSTGDNTDDANKVRVMAEFEGDAVVRGLGTHTFDNLFVDMDPEEIRSHSYGVLVHDCHSGHLWKTISEFYNSHK